MNVCENIRKLSLAPGWNCISSVKFSLAMHLVRFPICYCPVGKDVDHYETEGVEYIFEDLEEAIAILKYLFDKYHSLETQEEQALCSA